MYRNSLLLLALVLVAVRASHAGDPKYAIHGRTMGTTYSVTVFPEDTGLSQKLCTVRIDDRLDQVNAAMSTYIDDSDVTRFNRSRSTDWFPVGPDTLKVVAQALEISAKTEGAFDITVGPTVALWKFGAASDGTFEPPTDQSVNAALTRVGYQHVHVQAEPPAIRKSIAELEIDLSAIAKGFAVDEVAEVLRASGLRTFMIEIGGEVRAEGSKPDGTNWRIGIESPQRRQREVQTIIPLDDQSMATSGDYRNYYEHDGTWYSHTIDPKTGRPVQHQLASVTVLADDCTTADAMATALNVMGPDAIPFANEHGIPALFLFREGDTVREARSNSFPAVAANGAANAAPPSFLLISLITIGVFGVALVGLAIGAIARNKCIQGSCGGLANLSDEQGRSLCESCTRKTPQCEGSVVEGAAASEG